MVTQARKPQSKVSLVVKPHPVVVAPLDIEDVTPVEVLENEGAPPVKASEDELVLLQEVAEAAPEVTSEAPALKYEVRFTAAHTFGNRVYLEGETAFVPSAHPFYGMSPEEQEEKTGKIHFVPVTD